MNSTGIKWILFGSICLIWGSSFILMKEGMRIFSPYQVASVRILTAGLTLLPMALKYFRDIPRNKLGLVFISGIIGTFIPAYLFCIAETRIESALAGILNCLTPLSTILIGLIFFHYPLQWMKILGVLVGLSGLSALFLMKGSAHLDEPFYAGLVLLATVLYATNANMVSRHLNNLDSRKVVAVALVGLLPLAIIILVISGFFQISPGLPGYFWSTISSVVLGMLGTALATILFYKLLKMAGPVISSMVTYGIPFVAIYWGWMAGETISALQLICLGVILSGIFLANKK